jgi:hypothetical protein
VQGEGAAPVLRVSLRGGAGRRAAAGAGAGVLGRAAGLASPVTPAGAEQVLAHQLEYAHCMRAHGERDFPDPSASGGFSLPGSIDEHSSTFLAADDACKSLLPDLGPPAS